MRVPDALIGHTGFVGGNLISRHRFDGLFNSSNIEQISNQSYDTIVCAGAPAVKWKANQEPESDRTNLERLMGALRHARADRFVLISTVDVYPFPTSVDEDTSIDSKASSPYGRHRYLLERFVDERFDTIIVRLPGLFGPGLKKNIVYDLIHEHEVENICPASVFQFYPVVNLWDDLVLVEKHGLKLVNFATEPVSVERVALEVFDFNVGRLRSEQAASYDMRTKFANELGGRGDYMHDANTVLSFMKDYVHGTKR